MAREVTKLSGDTGFLRDTKEDPEHVRIRQHNCQTPVICVHRGLIRMWCQCGRAR